jgi:outer membrane assembly lipoprotein YfiO
MRPGGRQSYAFADMRNVQNILWALVLALVIGGPVANAQAEAQLVWNGKEWVSPTPAEPGTPEGDLAILRQMVDDGQNKRVVKAVEEFLVSHGESPACEEAMNLAGQSLINQGRYWDAYKWYERQISTYPNGAFFERALDREYLIADAFVNGRKRRAMKIFRVSADLDGVDMLMRISTHCPGTPIAERALLRVADFHFSRGEYPEAVACYEDFMKSHPLSEHRKFAMLQVARAYLLSYRGVKWDSTPLLDARKRYQLFAQAYPHDAEKENVEGILEEIRLGLAQKVYATGRFYERTKHPRAAAFYYRKTIAEYPDTHWANSARGRLDMLGPLPTDARPYTPPPPAPKVVQAESEEAPPDASPTAQAPSDVPEADLPAGPEPATETPAPTEPQDPRVQPVPLEDLSSNPPSN